MKTRHYFKKHILFFAIIAFGLISCDETNKIEPPAQTISPEMASELEEEFVTTRGRIINAALNKTDTREFWFSIDSLKKYIQYVEHKAVNEGKTNLGLRVYLAAYPENSNYPDPGFSTVFFAPTYQIETGAKGFFPIEPVNENFEGIEAFNYGQAGQPPKDYK